MSLIYKKGDLLQAKEDAICHGVNCMGVMGAGVAKQIARVFPEAEVRYKKLCLLARSKSTTKDLLGVIQAVKIDETLIINMFTQYDYGRSKRHADYKAIEDAFERLNELELRSVAICKIGAGLAGGDWQIIEKIILSKMNPETVVIVYEL